MCSNCYDSCRLLSDERFCVLSTLISATSPEEIEMDKNTELRGRYNIDNVKL